MDKIISKTNMIYCCIVVDANRGILSPYIYIMFGMFFHTSKTVAKPVVRLAGPSHFSGSMITNANSGRSGCSACGK